MKNKMFIACISGSIFALLTGSVGAGEPLALYDNFNAKFINLDKWYGIENYGYQGFNYYAGTREGVREIEGNRLHLLLRGYGNPDSDQVVYGMERLQFTNPNTITSVKATIKVQQYTLKSCADPDNPYGNGGVRARFTGFFFNTEYPAATDANKDVIANIGLSRDIDSVDPPNVFEARAAIAHCQDASCLYAVSIPENTYYKLGTVKVGQQATLRLEWDPPNKQFIAQLNKQSQVSMPYDFLNTYPSGGKNKRLEVRYNLINCDQTPRPTGFIEAYFDNVYVNESAVPVSVEEVTAD